MRGSPIIRAAVAFFGIVWLAVPISRMTRASVPAVQVVPPAATQTASFRIHFSHPVASMSLRHLGKEVLAIDSPTADLEKDIDISWPEEGVEIAVFVKWKEPDVVGQNGAIRLRVSAPDGEEYDKTLWGGPILDDVVGFP